MNQRQTNSKALLAGACLVILLHGITPGFALTPSSPKIQCTPASRCSLFRESDTISIQTTDNSAIQITDLDGAVVYQGPPTSLQLSRGHYFVTCSDDVNQFAVLPNDYVGSSLLGLEAGGPGTDPSIIDAVRPGWIRMGEGTGAGWDEVQPSAGTWNWAAADTIISRCVGGGRKVFWVAFVRPDWQTSDQQFILNYTNYVARVAQRYGSQLYAIVIWNEPWTTCSQWGRLPNPDVPNQCMTNWHQMVRSYVNVLRASRTAIKSAAPNVQVFGPSWANPQYEDVTAYLDALGGTSLLDTFTFHDYDCFGLPPDEDAPWPGTGTIMPRVDKRVHALRDAMGTSGIPFVLDEVGLFGQSALGIPNTGNPTYVSGISWQRGMFRTAKMITLYVAQGVQAISAHVLSTSTDDPANNIEILGYELGGRGPHPKTSAYLMTGYWLNNATLADFRSLGRRVFLYAWRRPDNTSLLFGWTLEDQTVALTSSRSVRDVFGRTKQINALTEEPVLFSSNDPNASNLLSSVMAMLAETINLPPVLSPIASQSVMKNHTLNVSVNASDPDNDPISYSTDALPEGATFDASTKTFSWTPTPDQIGTYEITFIATDARGLSGSTTTTVTVLGSPEDGLTHQWKFDESSGTIASDSAGSNPGALQNFAFNSTSGWTAGIDGNALSFDGVDDFVVLNSSQIGITNNFTIATWLYPRNASKAGEVFSFGWSYLTGGMALYVSGNSLEVQGVTATSTQNVTFADGLLVSNAWQHVAIVYDKSMMTVYLNGIARGSNDWGGDFVVDTAGQSRISADGVYSFNGLIDDVRIYNRTLSASEIQTLVEGAIPPVLSPIGPQRIHAKQTLNLNLSVSNANGGSLTYSAAPLPSGATLDVASGAFVWSPQTNQVGSHNVTFSVSNGQLSGSETVAITVTKPNSTPVLKPVKPKSVRAGKRVVIRLSAKDRDHDTLIYSLGPLPPNATFDALHHKLLWLTTNTISGTYSLTAGVTDGVDSDSKPVTITLQ